MSLRYILGTPGTGKTFVCFNEILAMQANEPGKNLIYIVPEQFTLQSEKELVKKSKNYAIMQAQVLSFERLAYRVFSETGRCDKKILEDIGKSMLLRKIVNELKGELAFFLPSAVEKQGFMEQLCETVTELYKYNMTAEILKQTFDTITDNEPLRLKLSDLYKILCRYHEYQEKNYISADEALDLLAQKVESSRLLSKANIWIDGFDGFTPQEYNVIERLLKTCERVTVTLPIDSVELLKDTRDSVDYYYDVKKTFNKLNETVAENIIDLEEPIELHEIHRLSASPEIKHLGDNFLKKFPRQFVGKTNHIKLISASNMYAETEYVASEIIRLVHERKYRYNEIGILSCSLDEHKQIIKSVFEKHSIPLFIDTKTEIISHPLIELIRACFGIITENWPYENVFRFLKTNLTDMDVNDIDLIENYVLLNGIKGKKWFADWEYGFDSSYEAFERDKINSLREKVINMLKPITDIIKPRKKYTSSFISKTLYKFLQKLNLEQIITARETHLINTGNLRLAKEYSQIWGKLITILEKMTEILGNTIMTAEEYTKIFDAGLSQMSLGVIPPSLDQIIVGDLRRSRIPEIKALFIIGATESALPSPFKETGLFNDDERSYLEKNHSVELMPSGFIKSYGEYFLIDTAFLKPREFLYLSYYLGGLDGKSFLPSPVIKRVKSIFSALSEQNVNGATEPDISAEFAYASLVSAIPSFIENAEIPDVYKDIYSALSDTKYYEKLKNILNNLHYADCELKLKTESVDKLYGRIIKSSVSRLERYIKCPFSYFAQYNLKAQKRRLYNIEGIDVGNLLHDILEEFSANVIDGVNWRDMDDKETATLALQAVDNALCKEKNHIFAVSPQHRFFAQRAKNIAVSSISAIISHMKSGGFDFGFSEAVFSGNQKDPSDLNLGAIEIPLSDNVKMLLEGRIDRIDRLKINDSEYIKIIDYKSGTTAFSFPEVFYGLQLQLIVYLDAFITKYKQLAKTENIYPAAVLYFKLDNPIIDFEKVSKADTPATALLKMFKMTGVVVNDIGIIKNIDTTFDSRSNIIPVGIKSSGVYKKLPLEERPLAEYSSALTMEDFQKLMGFVREKSISAGREILTGEISAKPFKYGNISACAYCDYKAICRFDPIQNAAEFNIMKPIKSKEAMDAILGGND